MIHSSWRVNSLLTMLPVNTEWALGMPKYVITAKRKLAPRVNWFRIQAPLIARRAQPGQFVIVRLHEKGERIPLTLFDWNANEGFIELVVQEVGKTTMEMGRYNVGDHVLNITGPLGNPTHIDMYGVVVIVCGGVGSAVCYPVAKALRERGNKVISIIGFRTRELVILEEEFRRISDEVIVTTDDGSYGVKGFTTDALRSLLESGVKPGLVYTAGPVIMMKKVAEITRRHGVLTYASLNPIMVDGTGMCGACRVTVEGRTVFACVDGPDFDAHKVDFDELAKRLAQYTEEERIALEKYLNTVSRGG